MQKITSDDYEQTLTAMKRFLILEIERAASTVGGYSELSRRLGKADGTVFATIKRSSFTSLDRLYRGILRLKLDKQ